MTATDKELRLLHLLYKRAAALDILCDLTMKGAVIIGVGNTLLGLWTQFIADDGAAASDAYRTAVTAGLVAFGAAFMSVIAGYIALRAQGMVEMMAVIHRHQREQ